MKYMRPVWLLSGYLGKSATTLLILWAFARLAGAQGAGEFSLAVAIAFPVFILAELALRNVYQTLTDPPPLRLFLALRALFAMTACLLLGTAGIFIDGMPPIHVLAPLLVMRLADSLLDMCFGGLQAEGRIGAAAAWMWLNTSLTLVAIATALALDLHPALCIAGSAAASVVVLAAASVTLLRRNTTGRDGFDRPSVGRTLRAGGTLGLAQGLDATLVYLPVLFLSWTATTEDVGVFAVCQYMLTLANLFFASVAQTSLTPMRRAYEEGLTALLRRATRISQALVALGLVGAVAAAVLLPPLAPAIFGTEFDVSLSEALPISIAVAVLAIEWSIGSVQLVLNRYGIRLIASLTGLGVSVAVAAATYQAATVATAGWVLLAGMIGRAAWSARGLRRTLREDSFQQPATERTEPTNR